MHSSSAIGRHRCWKWKEKLLQVAIYKHFKLSENVRAAQQRKNYALKCKSAKVDAENNCQRTYSEQQAEMSLPALPLPQHLLNLWPSTSWPTKRPCSLSSFAMVNNNYWFSQSCASFEHPTIQQLSHLSASRSLTLSLPLKKNGR